MKSTLKSLIPALLPKTSGCVSRWIHPRRMAWAVFSILFGVAVHGLPALGQTPAPRPLGNAHSHNDYMHARPLWDALDHGFTGVEADIHLVKGKLLVSHDAKDVRPDRTLEGMYLEPLRKLVRENQGRVLRGGPVQLLLIDIKTDAVPTYQALRKVLKSYADILTFYGPQGKKEGAVQVIVSGNRPYELMKAEKIRYAGMDGRLTDLTSSDSADLIPMISDTWEKNFKWRGAGPIPAEERRRLQDIIRQSHSRGRWVRFWATPDKTSPERETVWRELWESGVDFLNSDDHPGLGQFLRRQEGKSGGKALRLP